MEPMKICVFAVVTASAAMTGSAFADPDGTLVQTSTYNGTLWGNTSLWKGGEVVSGEGVVIDTGSGSPQVRMDDTNRVVGVFTTTRGTMPAEGGSFMFSMVNQGYTRTFDFTPPRVGQSTGFYFTTNTFTFANNGSPAQIRIDGGQAGAGTAKKPYRHFYDVPVILKDDLEIRHLFDCTNKYGTFTLSAIDPAAGVIFARPISGEGKGINVNNATATMGVMFGADNTFTGDLVVDHGLVRAIDAVDRPRAGTPFGVGNSVVATNDNSGVDLGGFVTGEGQTLVLKGLRYGINNNTATAMYTNGVLFSSYGRPYHASEWRGNVVLKGDTWLGGTIAGVSPNPGCFYPAYAEGDRVVSGPISESGGSAAIHVRSGNSVVLSGENTFSGGVYLDKGYFTARKSSSFGTGSVVFNGGIYRMEKPGDANVLEANVTGVPGNLRLHVDAGVTNIVPPNSSAIGYSDFYKYGEGALLLTNMVSLSGQQGRFYGGTVIFDTSHTNYVKFGINANNWQMNRVHLYNNAKLVVRGDPAQKRTGCWYGDVETGCAATLRVEDGQVFNISLANNNNNVLGYANLETDGSGAYFTIATTVADHAYVGNLAFLIYEESSFVTVDGGKAVPMPDSSYATSWGGATDCVDVTPALAALSVPDGTSADVLRFNTSNGGSELVLTLDGDLTLAGRTILVTPAMGATKVRITGGTIRSESFLRILNFNTSAPLVIESDIGGLGTDIHAKIVSGGPGKTVFSGAKSFSNQVLVLGGELESDCADSLGKPTSDWPAYSQVYIYNGGILSFDGTFCTTQGTVRTTMPVYVSSSGGAIKVPNPSDTVTLGSQINLNGGGHFRKLGPGTLKFSGDAKFERGNEGGVDPNLMHVEYCEGTVVQDRKFSEGTEFTLADNGVTLLGDRWLQAWQAGANGGGNRLELSSKRMLHIGSGGATVDVHGVSVTINDQNAYYGFIRCPEFLSGDGELTIVDSAGGATLKPNGYRDASFRGKFTSYVPVDSSNCMELRNAEMHIPRGITNKFSGILHDRSNVRFGRLSGEGTLHVITAQAPLPAYVFLGQDDAPDADFPGTLLLKHNASQYAYPQLVKIGGNAQRISGGANELLGNVIVRAGSLLAGNDSSGTQGSGAFGAAMVFLGDEETPAGASPAFLADGAFTVANEIRVPDTSLSSAVPVLGGTTNANGAVFSGPVKLRRDVAFMAGDGATVTFTGEISGLQGVSMRGGGRVVIDGDVALGGDFDWTGGTLEATGRITVPAGATLTVDESLCTRENIDKVFFILKAEGGINGKFECPQTLPGNWRILQKEGSIRLYSPKGFSIFVR